MTISTQCHAVHMPTAQIISYLTTLNVIEEIVPVNIGNQVKGWRSSRIASCSSAFSYGLVSSSYVAWFEINISDRQELLSLLLLLKFSMWYTTEIAYYIKLLTNGRHTRTLSEGHNEICFMDVILICRYRRSRSSPAVFIAETSAINNWRKELCKH